MNILYVNIGIHTAKKAITVNVIIHSMKSIIFSIVGSIEPTILNRIINMILIIFFNFIFIITFLLNNHSTRAARAVS